MAEIKPVPASTVTLIRDSAHGLEVLLMQRNYASGFMPGMHLFPGGALDEADASVEIGNRCTGLDDATASGVLGIARGGLAYWIAAIREAFEEAGVLLTYGGRGEPTALDRPELAERFDDHRRALNAGERDFADMLRSEDLRLAVDRLVYFSHWITPVSAPRRYDTRFFLAMAPEDQQVLHDNRETIGHVWVHPAEALDKYRRGEFKMRTPTVKTLEEFAAFASADSLLRAQRARRAIPAILPRIGRDGIPLMPGDPGYEEAAAVEEQGQWRI
jgi:8-oxo-dGTP pyrophosphatase MutT (NUDIX family)